MNTNTKTIKSPVKLDAEYTRLGIDFFGLDNFEALLQMILETSEGVVIKPSKDDSTFDLYSNVSDLFTINRKNKDGFFDRDYRMNILGCIEATKIEMRDKFDKGFKELTDLKSVKLLLNAEIVETSDILLGTRFTRRDLEKDSIYLMAERRAPRVSEAGVSMQS